ncbi:MAG: HlyD family secretion protein [Pirellulaceae bacterium]
MIKYLITIATVGSIIFLGMSINSSSRTEAVHSDMSDEPTAIYASGRVEGATKEINLRPQLPGRVAEILVHESSPVTADQPLMRIDDREYRHAVSLARAELQSAEAKLQRLVNGARVHERREAEALWKGKSAELERARLQWKRVRNLRAGNAVTEQEADDQRLEVTALEAAVEAARARYELLESPARPDEVQMAEAAIAAAQAKLEVAQLQLSRAQLLTPVAGQIVLINAKVGELVGPDMTEPAMVVADTHRCRIRAFVEEYDAPRVHLGMTATISTDGIAGKNFRGTVSQLSPRMDRKHHWTDAANEQFDTKTREIWIDLEQANPMVLGLRVDVVIHPM